jgi:integrase
MATVSGKWSTPKRCNCKDGRGKELGRTCQRLSGRHHGTHGYDTRIPTSSGIRTLRRFGFPTQNAAHETASQVWDLIKLAGADTRTQQRIGDLIFRSTARGGQLPSVEDVRRRLGLGLDPAQPGAIVASWLESWLAGKRRTKRASTVRGYESHIRVYINPVIGDLPLERLNVGHVEAVLAAVPGSAGTRHRVLATLRAALNAAVKQRQITWNPCTGIELESENPAEAGRWTPAEAARFLVYTADDPTGLMFRVMVLRGCRRAELCGFRWSFADLDRGVLTVKRTVLQLGGKLHEEPTAKTKAGDRLVFPDAETADLLRAHHRVQLRTRMKAGPGWQDNDLIFCQADGRPWNPDHVSKRFKKLAAQAGVPVIKLHEGGRHTGNSLMRDAGVDQEVRMREVGHAGRDINDRYTHVLIEAHLAAAEQTAALVRDAGNAAP